MRRTKIVCTLGPASDGPGVLEGLVRAGMDVARLNFSHGTHGEHLMRMEAIRYISRALGRTVGVLQDLGGPKIRTGALRGGEVELKAGSKFTITTRKVEGNSERVQVHLPEIVEAVKSGDPILLGDGAIQLEVLEAGGDEVRCKVVVGGRLGPHKGVALPETALDLPALTERDRADMKFGLEHGVDFVALSFVRGAEDVREAKGLIEEAGYGTPVVAKIEKVQAMENIGEIVRVADGLMVARGDLGVETPLEKVPLLQKRIIAEGNAQAKPVITATQMLLSMVNNPRPTRAEVADVTSAVLDGTDALMLSEETALGRYPVEAVSAMGRIAEAAEAELHPREAYGARGEIPLAITRAACTIARDLGAKAILAPTRSGTTARLIARYRPQQPILGMSSNPKTVKELTLTWGVLPLLIEDVRSTDSLLERAEEAARQTGLAGPGDTVVVTAGQHKGGTGPPNLIRVVVLE